MIGVKIIGFNGDKKKIRYISAIGLPDAILKSQKLKNGKSNLPFFNKIISLEVVEEDLI